MFKLNIRPTSNIQQVNKLPLELQNNTMLPYVHEIRTRKILPQENIDLQIKLDEIVSNKTIVHIIDRTHGFGDFLRGSILLAEIAKKNKINFKMDMADHCISNYLELKNENCNYDKINKYEIVYNYINYQSNFQLFPFIQKFILSKDNICPIYTNLFYNPNLVTNDIKDYINNFLTFKPEYYEKVKELTKNKKYNILHIRCKDEYFNKEFHSDKLFVEIIKLQLGKNTIVISNNTYLKRKLNKIFGFAFIDNTPAHTATINNDKYLDIESTIIDYIILSKSCYTNCFSFYYHGSGFSEQCSILNNIPYTVTYLPNESIITSNIEESSKDITLLLNHYNERMDWSLKKSIETKENYDNIAFITLTNTGYVDYTLNCLESLCRSNTEKGLVSYCIGIYGYNKIKKNGFDCKLIDDKEDDNSKFIKFTDNDFARITYNKFKIIYENLLTHSFVCITDGDIVYEKNGIFDFLLTYIEDNDVLIQSEGLTHPDLCSGFMFIKSNELTREVFNPENVTDNNEKNWNDQVYVNKIKYKLKYKKLPLYLFPTGNYYYEYSINLDPYLIHFNWVVGHEKQKKMIQYKKWFIL